MMAIFTALRLLVAAYKALRAAVGIMLVAHGAYVWTKNKRAAAAA